MKDETIDAALARLAGKPWRNDLHRERLGRELAREHGARFAGRSRLPRALLAGVLLAGAAYGAVKLSGWTVRTTVGDRDLGTSTVEIDAAGAGSFVVPVEELGADGEALFNFELEGLEAPWVEFDIRIENGLAHVTVKEHDAAPIDPAAARAAIEGLRAIAAADAGGLWGAPLDGPLLFVEPATRTAVAEVPDAEGRLFPWRGLHAGRLPADVPVANTASDWAGRLWTMVMWPLPAGEARDALLVHESFHQAQRGLGLYVHSAPCAHLDDTEGRVWLRLEGRALDAALAAEAGSEGCRKAVRDALLFRARRRALAEASAACEDALERVEGTAEYTGVRLGYRTGASRRAAARAALERIASHPSLARSFPYLTGPALGLLLDDLAPGWREDYLAGASFGELLAPAAAFEAPADLAALAERRAERYGRAEVTAEEARRAEERAARVAALRARFVEGPTLRLPMRDSQLTFDPNGAVTLGDEGTVYSSFWARDAWGVLDAKGGALMSPSGWLRVPAPETAEERAGEGWTLTLEPGWSLAPGPRAGDFEAAPD